MGTKTMKVEAMEINYKDKVVIKDARIRAAKLLLKAAEGEDIHPHISSGRSWPGTSMNVNDALQWVIDAFGMKVKPTAITTGATFPSFSVSVLEAIKQEEIMADDYVDDSVVESKSNEEKPDDSTSSSESGK